MISQIVKTHPKVDSLVIYCLSLVRIIVADSKAKNYPYVAMVWQLGLFIMAITTVMADIASMVVIMVIIMVINIKTSFTHRMH